jgi:hypothetical protein
MANLHIFGDSYSVKWDSLSSPSLGAKVLMSRGLIPPFGKRKRYKDLLGRTPKHFGDIIKKAFNIDKIYYRAIGGFDNYSILESIGRHIHTIKKKDYVCIGWSDITRYRILGIEPDKWTRMLINTSIPNYLNNVVPKEYYKQCVERDCNLTIKEIEYWQNILKLSLPNNTMFWSPFNIARTTPWLTFPNEPKLIKDECDIKDSHFSETGMIQIGEWMVSRFKSNSKNLL